MKSLSKDHKGSLYAICSGLSYGMLGYFGISLIHANYSVFNMLFWRFLVSSLIMLIILIPKYTLFIKQFKESVKVFCYGIFFYSVSSVLYFISSKYIGTGLAMVIFYIYPAFVMLLNKIFYKAKINKSYYFAIVMLIIGLVFFIDIQAVKLDVIGIGIGIIGALFYAAYIVANKESEVHPLISTLMVISGCMVACLVYTIIDDSLVVPRNVKDWANLFGVSMICTTLPILLLLKGLQYISAEKASILSVLEPVFVVIVGILLLNEQINSNKVIGIILVLSGALVTLFNNPKQPDGHVEMIESP